MQRSVGRILTTHAGSLVRPLPILKVMKALDLHQEIDEEAFASTLREAVSDVVEQQLRAGIDVPSDGEFGRAGFTRYIWQRLEGLEPRELEPGESAWTLRPEAQEFPGFFKQWDAQYRKNWMHPEVSLDDMPNLPGTFERFRVTGPIKYRGHEAIRQEIDRLTTALAGHQVADAFIPSSHAASGRGDKDILKHYPNEESYLYALADAFHEEYKAITDAGFLLQVDYPVLMKPAWLLANWPAAEQAEVKRVAEMGLEALNHALRDIPEEKVRFHYCWGSQNVPHTLDPPLREVLPLILKVKAQAYSIEAANPRHEHEWMVWKDVKLPEGKILIPGIVSHQTNVVEHPELVAWRIENFASVVGKENVIAGTDCGFSQHWDNIRVHPEVQWAKLQSLAEGAALASQKLWS